MPLFKNPFSSGLVKVALSVCLVLNAIEFVCFIVIFVELHQHHKRHVALCMANNPQSASNKEKRQVSLAHNLQPKIGLNAFSSFAGT